jgi:hypothetical protein
VIERQFLRQRQRRHLDLFARQILTIAIDLCCRSSRNNQSDDSSRFAERRGIFYTEKKCAKEVGPGVVLLRLKLFFLLGGATRFFLRGVAFLFPFFLPEKFDNHQCS